MDYQYPIRYLTRTFYHKPPTLTSAKNLGALASAMGVGDLSVDAVNQFTTNDNVLSKATAFNAVGSGSRVIVGRESVDFEHLPMAARGAALSPDEFVRTAAAVALVVGAGAGQAYRLAIVFEGLLREPAQGMDEVAKKLLRLPPTFSPAPFEWDWRCIATVDRTFSGREEKTNTLAVVKRTQGVIVGGPAFDSIRFDLDINTVPANTKERFGPQDAHSFFTEALRWHIELWREMATFAGIGVN